MRFEFRLSGFTAEVFHEANTRDPDLADYPVTVHFDKHLYWPFSYLPERIRRRLPSYICRYTGRIDEFDVSNLEYATVMVQDVLRMTTGVSVVYFHGELDALNWEVTDVDQFFSDWVYRWGMKNTTDDVQRITGKTQPINIYRNGVDGMLLKWWTGEKQFHFQITADTGLIAQTALIKWRMLMHPFLEEESELDEDD